MSDDASPTKRGRKSNADKVEKVDNKKRARKEVKPAVDSGDDEVPVKRGRGRPKGTTKKKTPVKPKAKSTATGRRGRPKKEEPKDSADEDDEENDANEDEDD